MRYRTSNKNILNVSPLPVVCVPTDTGVGLVFGNKTNKNTDLIFKIGAINVKSVKS